MGHGVGAGRLGRSAENAMANFTSMNRKMLPGLELFLKEEGVAHDALPFYRRVYAELGAYLEAPVATATQDQRQAFLESKRSGGLSHAFSRDYERVIELIGLFVEKRRASDSSANALEWLDTEPVDASISPRSDRPARSEEELDRAIAGATLLDLPQQEVLAAAPHTSFFKVKSKVARKRDLLDASVYAPKPHTGLFDSGALAALQDKDAPSDLFGDELESDAVPNAAGIESDWLRFSEPKLAVITKAASEPSSTEPSKHPAPGPAAPQPEAETSTKPRSAVQAPSLQLIELADEDTSDQHTARPGVQVPGLRAVQLPGARSPESTRTEREAELRKLKEQIGRAKPAQAGSRSVAKTSLPRPAEFRSLVPGEGRSIVGALGSATPFLAIGGFFGLVALAPTAAGTHLGVGAWVSAAASGLALLAALVVGLGAATKLRRDTPAQALSAYIACLQRANFAAARLCLARPVGADVKVPERAMQGRALGPKFNLLSVGAFVAYWRAHTSHTGVGFVARLGARLRPSPPAVMRTIAGSTVSGSVLLAFEWADGETHVPMLRIDETWFVCDGQLEPREP